MRVLDTDYRTYAILYRCLTDYTFDLQGGEQVLVLTRENSQQVERDGKKYDVLPEGVQTDIEESFSKLFNVPLDDENVPLVFSIDMMKTN